MFRNQRNPILPLDFHLPDVEARKMPDGRLYLYGSHDKYPNIFCSEDYQVVSTKDLEHWEIHPVSFTGEQVPWFDHPDYPKYSGIDWSKPTPFIQKMLASPEAKKNKEKFEQETGPRQPLLFAPDAIYHNGQYYLYFCMPDDSEGVAIADSPIGPFEKPQQLPLGGIDPAIFIDDDGQAYFYWGQLAANVVPLNSDLVSFDETKIVRNLLTETEHFFHEGISIRKIKNIYYAVYCSIENGKPTNLSYATSDSPLGPFIHQGVLINNEKCDPKSWNNHGSIEEFQGQWYLFYHRSTRNHQEFRRLCIEPITVNSDGTIAEVLMTSQGVGMPFKSGEMIYGYQACELTGALYIDVSEVQGEALVNIINQDQALFRYFAGTDNFYEIEINGSGHGIIKVYAGEKLLGTVTVTEGQGFTENLQFSAGVHPITLVFNETRDLVIDNFRLTEKR